MAGPSCSSFTKTIRLRRAKWPVLRRAASHNSNEMKGMAMRYMLLIHMKEAEAASADGMKEVSAAHWAVMDETTRRGISAAPIHWSPRRQQPPSGGQVLLTDGPFAETKEQLAGYYILECSDLDEAFEWAARIHGACRGTSGIEVRPIREMRNSTQTGAIVRVRKGVAGCFATRSMAFFGGSR